MPKLLLEVCDAQLVILIYLMLTLNRGSMDNVVWRGLEPEHRVFQCPCPCCNLRRRSICFKDWKGRKDGNCKLGRILSSRHRVVWNASFLHIRSIHFKTHQTTPLVKLSGIWDLTNYSKNLNLNYNIGTQKLYVFPSCCIWGCRQMETLIVNTISSRNMLPISSTRYLLKRSVSL